MFQALFGFFLSEWRHLLLPHIHRDEFIYDENHYLYRRYTRRYQRKQNILKSLWIGTGLLIFAFPLLHFIAIICLLNTFISFMFLDEVK